MSIERKGRGSALLMTLWLSAALSAIALSVALTVRSEIQRADTGVEGLRAYYMARGAADRALNYILYGSGTRLPNGAPRFWEPGMPLIRMEFPGGEAMVEVSAESSKLNVNDATVDELTRLIAVLGAPPEQARQLAMAIVHWRGTGGGPFDPMYLAQVPSFRAPHASIEQIEELMSVAGITPDLFYGGYMRTPEGGLVPRSGLRDCLSVYSSGSGLDINFVDPAVMIALGIPAPAAVEVVKMRRQGPLRDPQLNAIRGILGPAGGRLRVGGDNIYTLRATARLRKADGSLSDLQRTVTSTIALNSKVLGGFRVMQWQDQPAGGRSFEVWPQ